ncbi:hypothetical protein SAZ11_56635 [Streptomyces sp. FXJ1.4098]|nr:hypothetical protein [Streptomyces sp. FXJ1.4098]
MPREGVQMVCGVGLGPQNGGEVVGGLYGEGAVVQDARGVDDRGERAVRGDIGEENRERAGVGRVTCGEGHRGAEFDELVTERGGAGALGPRRLTSSRWQSG